MQSDITGVIRDIIPETSVILDVTGERTKLAELGFLEVLNIT